MAKRKYKRRTGYSDEIAEIVCNRIAEGESLTAICCDEGMPSRRSFSNWLADKAAKYDKLRALWNNANQLQEDKIFDEMMGIADDGTNDYMERKRRNGEVEIVVDHENVHRSKLRVETRKWILARRNPKKYGERSVTELTGKDGGPIQTEETTLTREQVIDGIVERLGRNGVLVDPSC